MNLILASKSERRSSLLKKLKIDFNIQDSKLDESKISIKNPSKYCQILANMKDTTERIVVVNHVLKGLLDQSHAYLMAINNYSNNPT